MNKNQSIKQSAKVVGIKLRQLAAKYELDIIKLREGD